ncbi:MAG: phosphatase PAP2 family protein, partial [bacterium]|nr:phosphatase PAP2 family protein [bacterium]
GWKATPILILPLGMGSATVILGHHYVVDLIVGACYALVCFTAVYLWHRRSQSKEA